MGAPAQGREGAGKMAGEEQSRGASRLQKSHPYPPPASHAESYYSRKHPWRCVPLDRGGRPRSWGQARPLSRTQHIGL